MTSSPRLRHTHARALAGVPALALPIALVAACAAPSTPASGSRPVATSRLGQALRSLRRSVGGADRWDAAPATTTVLRIIERPARRDERRDTAPAAVAAFDSTEWPTTVIPITSETAAERTLWVGDRLALDPPPAPAGTPAAMAADLRWSSLDPVVAQVSADGVVMAMAPGTAGIRAWRRVGDVTTPLRVLPAVRGRVATADGGMVAARVVIRSAGRVDTVVTDGDGAFAFRPTDRLRAPVSVAFEPLDTRAAYAPAVLRSASLDGLADLRAVLLPITWRLRAGTYAGGAVPISPAIAQARAREGSRFWRVAGRQDEPASGQPAVGWSPDDLPLPLAFDHTSSAIGAADSIAFWRIVRQLEADWGAPLFRPATRAPEDSLLVGGGVTVTVDGRIRSAGLTTTSWNGDGDVSDAVVAVRSRDLLGDPAIVTHELLHALGIGHAAPGWSSVMHPTADGAASGRASIEDVAYGQLLYAVRARTHAAPGRRPVGIAEAAAAASGVP